MTAKTHQSSMLNLDASPLKALCLIQPLQVFLNSFHLPCAHPFFCSMYTDTTNALVFPSVSPAKHPPAPCLSHSPLYLADSPFIEFQDIHAAILAWRQNCHLLWSTQMGNCHYLASIFPMWILRPPCGALRSCQHSATHSQKCPLSVLSGLNIDACPNSCVQGLQCGWIQTIGLEANPFLALTLDRTSHIPIVDTLGRSSPFLSPFVTTVSKTNTGCLSINTL